MIVSICPTFYCNNRCEYCYLSNLFNYDVLDLNKLQDCLRQLSNIELINIYGGEISCLHINYLKQLKEICNFCTINITTNLYDQDKIIEVFGDVNISVSLNSQRPDYKKIRYKLSKFEIPFSLIHVVFKSDLSIWPSKFLDSFNFKLCKSISLAEYSPVKRIPHLDITNEQYQQFLIGILNYYLHNKQRYNFTIENLYNLELCKQKQYFSVPNYHVFINPKGQFGECVYENGYEKFVWFDTFEEFKQFCKSKPLYKGCLVCKYKNNCYAEHLRPDRCTGNLNVLKWYENL